MILAMNLNQSQVSKGKILNYPLKFRRMKSQAVEVLDNSGLGLLDR